MSTTTTLPARWSRRRLLGLAIVGGALGYVGWRQYATAPFYAGGKLDVTQAHAQAASGDIVLIDIRRPDEWKRTGIGQGAHPIDMRREDFVTALAEVAGSDKTRAIALICARGVRSARMSKRLTAAGFTNVIDVPEGMLGSAAGPGWLATNLAVRPYGDGS